MADGWSWLPDLTPRQDPGVTPSFNAWGPFYQMPFGGTRQQPTQPLFPFQAFPPSPVVPSRQTVPTAGALPSSPQTPAVQGKNPIDWGTVAGTVAPLLVSLFGSNPAGEKAGQSTDMLTNLAQSLSRQGQGIAGQGQQALAPVLQLLTALVGGDQAALSAATAPERVRVLDQYDTARKALQFLPRGGGQAGAVMQAGAKQAGDLASIIGLARQGATKQLGELGTELTRTGLTAEQSGAQDLRDAAEQYQRQAEERNRNLGLLGGAIGDALPAILKVFLP